MRKNEFERHGDGQWQLNAGCLGIDGKFVKWQHYLKKLNILMLGGCHKDQWWEVIADEKISELVV